MNTTLTFRERVIWLAALWEGEGSFRGVKEAENKGHAVLSLMMTDQDVIEQAHQWMGVVSKIRIREPRKPQHKRAYFFAFSGHLARSWMMMLYPFLGKRRRAKIRSLMTYECSRPIYQGYRIACPQGHPYRQYPGYRRCPICDQRRERQRESSYADSPDQLRFAP